MKIEVQVETGGSAPTGVSISDIEKDIQAQLDRLADQVGVERAKESRLAAPAEAQGIDQIIAWTMELAQDPKMAKAYASATIFAINQILKSRNVTEVKNQEGSDSEGLGAKVKLLGKELRLPVATAVIGKLLQDMFGE